MTAPFVMAATETGQETVSFEDADFGPAACGTARATCFEVPAGTDIVVVELRNTENIAGLVGYSLGGYFEGRNAAGEIVCRNAGYGNCTDIDGTFCNKDAIRIDSSVVTMYVELAEATQSAITCAFDTTVSGEPTTGTAKARFFID